MLCSSCKLQKPENIENGKVYKSCKECLTKDRLNIQKRKQRKAQVEYNKETQNVCSYKSCLNVFDNYTTSNNLPGTKCKTHYEQARKHSLDSEERKKKKIEENSKLTGLDPDKDICYRCGNVFIKFKNVRNLWSRACKHCHELSSASKRSDRENNPEKFKKRNEIAREKQYWKDTRTKKIQEVGIKEYRKRNAEIAKNYRENNKETVKEMTRKSHSTNTSKFSHCKRQSFIRGILFELSFDEYCNLLQSPCFYCKSTDNLNIDRIDSKSGYTLNNCVSCCKICNLMKNTFDVFTFLNQCKLVCYNKGLIDFDENETFEYRIPDVMNDVSYCKYNTSAIKRQKQFDISREIHEKLISLECYLCGIPPGKFRDNGVDRVDNDIGYIESNCESCCYVCNFMKKTYNLELFLSQVVKIYTNTKEIIDDFNNTEYIGPAKKNFEKAPKEVLEEIRTKKREEADIKLLRKYNIDPVNFKSC